MRFGLDIAQQRQPWSELAGRARFADGLGFDGIWGFDHFQPMYGEGPGETFDGMTTLAALASITNVWFESRGHRRALVCVHDAGSE